MKYDKIILHFDFFSFKSSLYQNEKTKFNFNNIEMRNLLLFPGKPIRFTWSCAVPENYTSVCSAHRKGILQTFTILLALCGMDRMPSWCVPLEVESPGKTSPFTGSIYRHQCQDDPLPYLGFLETGMVSFKSVAAN